MYVVALFIKLIIHYSWARILDQVFGYLFAVTLRLLVLSYTTFVPFRKNTLYRIDSPDNFSEEWG